MNHSTQKTIRVMMTLLLISAGAAFAQNPTIDWHTIDGGGEMISTGGGFELGGTIGQADASSFSTPMTGGGFELVGGFWGVVATAPIQCACLSDLDGDGFRTGGDIQGFVDCLIATGSNCTCADVDGVPGLDLADVTVFVQDLLDGTPCP